MASDTMFEFSNDTGSVRSGLTDLPSLPDRHPVVRFRACWNSLKGSQPLPQRRAFHPRQVVACLPFIVLLERISCAPPRYRYRLTGQEMRRLIGRPVRGLTLDEVLDPGLLDRQTRAYEQAFQERRPVYRLGTAPVLGRDYIKVVSGYFPFQADPLGQLFVVAAPTDLKDLELLQAPL